jgi:hypothetical protein
MNTLQELFVIAYGLVALCCFLKGFYEIRTKKNAFGSAPLLVVFGVFVWGDALILGPFWMAISLTSLIVRDWYLFLLLISVFWVVRSLGEVIYWLNEQFAGKNRNPPHTLRFHGLLKSDAVWFVYQLIWQCVLVISLVVSLFVGKLWLSK